MNEYKVEFHGYALVYAESKEEAKEMFMDDWHERGWDVDTIEEIWTEED